MGPRYAHYKPVIDYNKENEMEEERKEEEGTNDKYEARSEIYGSASLEQIFPPVN